MGRIRSLTRVVALACLTAAPVEARELGVCDDPNNLPFSNEKLQGFENKIVDLVAKDLDATVAYTWWAERRGFVRNTLKAGRCDLIPGFPSAADLVRATAPYYRSTYVFVTRQDGPDIESFDDPALRTLKVGVQIIGNDHFSTPPAHALARRGIIDNVRGFSVYGDYSQPDPPARILDAVVGREVDVAAVWGPLAGYFTKRDKLPLKLTPVSPAIDGPNLPMVFDISMGVRREDGALLREVGASLAKHKADIAAILADYGVPGATLGSPRPVKRAAHALVAFLALASPSLRAGAAGKGTQFWNLATTPVTHLRLAPAGSRDFGPDQAANDPDGTVDLDERVRITGVETGRYDLSISFKGGRTCLVRNVTVEDGKIFAVDAKALTDCSK